MQIITINIDEGFYKKLEDFSKEKGKSVNSIIIHATSGYIRRVKRMKKQ